ncbi:hypothetical protein F5Y11DRAFT_364727 [Daldinia sp. FL1419]|nr:hypothetical protein F5Y11DRAFT_364727 [Daldinia sp. FL1419]
MPTNIACALSSPLCESTSSGNTVDGYQSPPVDLDQTTKTVQEPNHEVVSVPGSNDTTSPGNPEQSMVVPRLLSNPVSATSSHAPTPPGSPVETSTLCTRPSPPHPSAAMMLTESALASPSSLYVHDLFDSRKLQHTSQSASQSPLVERPVTPKTVSDMSSVSSQATHPALIGEYTPHVTKPPGDGTRNAAPRLRASSFTTWTMDGGTGEIVDAVPPPSRPTSRGSTVEGQTSEISDESSGVDDRNTPPIYFIRNYPSPTGITKTINGILLPDAPEELEVPVTCSQDSVQGVAKSLEDCSGVSSSPQPPIITSSPAEECPPHVPGTPLDDSEEKLLAKQPVVARIVMVDHDLSVSLGPSSPTKQTTATVDQVKSHIQTAMDQIKAGGLLRLMTIWDQAFGPNREEELVSTLEQALMGMSEIESELQARGIPYTPADESSDESSCVTSIAESTCSGQPPNNAIPLRAGFASSYTIDTKFPWHSPAANEVRDINTLDKPVHGPCLDLERFAKILGKYLSRKPVLTPASSKVSESGEDDNIAEQAKNGIQSAHASKLEYMHVDELWDPKAGAYKIVKSVHSKFDELDEYAFVVRQRTDKTTQKSRSYLDIKSTFLRDILRETCHDVRGISLAENTPSIERDAMFHVHKDLQQYQQRLADEGEETMAEKHLAVFMRYLETAFKPVEDRLSVLLTQNEITYDLLWALFKPNAEVYTSCRGTNVPRCVLFNHLEERTDVSGSKFIRLETRYLGSDGKSLGEVTTSSSIAVFRGAMRIELLPAYPLQYHPEAKEIRNQLVDVGRKFVSLLGIHHRQYTGRAFDIDDEGEIVASHVDGRIMIDSACFHENKPNYPCPRVQKVRPKFTVLGRCDAVKLVNLDPAQLAPNDLLICTPTVLGFSLEKKAFFEFAVAHVGDIEWSTWSDCSFKDVKIHNIQKKAIYALTKTYLSSEADDGFQDLVQGKGHGINFLLYGPPGVGKTLTAETLAETFKAPLYTVPAGQIGVEHTRVERYLKNIFKIASRWKAILLLDEADVFLAERTNDPHVNALVSVFLRELERYEGILFFTTNRMQMFDAAILSRIHLALRYEPLKKDARKAIWRLFLLRAKTKAG